MTKKMMKKDDCVNSANDLSRFRRKFLCNVLKIINSDFAHIYHDSIYLIRIILE